MALWMMVRLKRRILFLYKLAEMIKIPDAFVTESIADAFITNIKIPILIIQTLSNIFMIKRLKV
jgi:hypothetical protein